MRGIWSLRDPIGWVFLVVVLATPIFGDAQTIFSMTAVGFIAISVIGLNVLIGQAGQVNFACGVFMALGGYGVAILGANYGWNPVLALLVSAVVSACVAVLIGLPLLRLHGHYLAVATFAVALAFETIAAGAEGLTGGANGIAGIPPLSIGGFALDTSMELYAASWICCGLALWVFMAFKASHIGRGWRALSVNEDVAKSLGLHTARLKLLAFIVSAVLGSISGSLYVEFTSFISSDLFGLGFVINLFLMLFVGGRGIALGPIAGAAIVVFVPQFLASASPQAQSTIFLSLLLAIILLWPQGLLGTRGTRIFPWLASRRLAEAEQPRKIHSQRIPGQAR